MYEQIMKGGGLPAESMGPDGKPIIDEEGGAVIQPNPGFVIKTKDETGQKVFINMTHHELVDPFEEKPIPESEEKGIRIPLSLGSVREDYDKSKPFSS